MNLQACRPPCTPTKTAIGPCPGDDKGSDRWGLTPPSTAGNGVIEGAYASTAPTDESRLFGEHLRRAGFVAGDGSENPFNAVFGKTGVRATY